MPQLAPSALDCWSIQTGQHTEGMINFRQLTRGPVQVLCINEEVARLRSGARISEKCLDLQQQRAKRQAGPDDTAARNGSKAKVTAANASSDASKQGLPCDAGGTWGHASVRS